MNIATRFGRYEIQKELGRGAMATVYQAFDPKSGREVAIKVLPREMLHDLQFRSRFEKEIKLVAGLEHPAIVPVYDVGEEKGQPYFVMRYMNGGSLAQRIAKGRLSLAEAAGIIAKIAPALAYAHQKGVIHRDLKPDNILFDQNGEPFISDFGIAKLFSGTGSLTGKEYVGTPAYMSPEQAQGKKLDGRSDVYSLGVVVFEMLTGEKPYQADNPIGVAINHITQPVPQILRILQNLPEEVDIFIRTAMSKDKSQRYSSPIELARALNVAAFGKAGDLPAHTADETSKVKSILFLAGIFIVMAAVIFLLLREQLFAAQQPTPTPLPSHTAPPPTFTLTPITPPTQSATVTAAPSATALPPTATAPSFAPACVAAPAIPTPKVNWLDSFCFEKTPYTTITIPEGATFEVINPDFFCKAEVTKNGKTTLSCSGKPLYSFDLKVCQPPASPTESGQCPPGDQYDPAQQCCAAPLPSDASCILFKVDIRSCQ